MKPDQGTRWYADKSYASTGNGPGYPSNPDNTGFERYRGRTTEKGKGDLMLFGAGLFHA
ncbi:MAG: hypothetical protein ACKVE4_01155 [Dissulfuribacterales bacterium]